jgi:hypothetical protein
MSDLGWLTGFGQRSRAATGIPKRSEHRGPSQSPSPQVHRVSSLLSLGRVSSPPVSPPPPQNTSEPRPGDIIIKESDRVWHNPSLLQMVEALQVIMMTKPVLDPVPVQYNSYILHLIEGFANLQKRNATLNRKLREATDGRERDLEQFKALCEEWINREKGYKDEIKRLEVILARESRGGLSTVTLARADSVVDRSGQDAGSFMSRLRQAGKISQHGKTCPQHYDPPTK